MRMSRLVRLWRVLQITAWFLLSLPPAFSQVEAFRVRVVLLVGGTVGVSLDEGRRFTPIGRVVALPQRPVTTATTTAGKAALYRPKMWWLQYHQNQGVALAASGVQTAGALLTDVPAESLLFRSEHSALSARLLLQEGHVAYSLPPYYRYQPGHVWVLQLMAPDEATARSVREAIQAHLATEAQQAARRSLERAQRERLSVVKGTLNLEVTARYTERVQFVFFAVDGYLIGTSNTLPTIFRWDSTQVSDGEYVLEARAVDKEGRELALVRRRVLVQNGR